MSFRILLERDYGISNCDDCEELARDLFNLMQITKVGVRLNFTIPWSKAEFDFDPEHSKEYISGKIISWYL